MKGNKNTYRFIISGGGTGGHIYPAIAIARAIEEVLPSAEIMFVGAKGRMEMEKVPAEGYPIEGLRISGIQRKLSVKNLLFPFKLAGSLLKSYRIIGRFKPHAVIGVGGYASGPLGFVAAKKGVPLFLQEQNSFAGITNKLLARYAEKIFVAHQAMDQFFPKERIVFTGNPIRKNIVDALTKSLTDPKDAREQFGLNRNKFTVLVIGGSQGARQINNSIFHALNQFNAEDIQLIWQCGKLYYKEFKQKAEGKFYGQLMPFIERMDIAYGAADLVVSRAGALSVSELCLVAKPVIFIPSPNVAEDHQRKNAEALVGINAGEMIADKDAPAQLGPAVVALAGSPETRQTYSTNIQTLARPKASIDIAGEILQSLKVNLDVADSSDIGIEDLGRFNKVYFLGIGGIGMSALACWFLNHNYWVGGYDRTESSITSQLTEKGVDINYDDAVDAIPEKVKQDPEKTLVIRTPAIPEDHKGWQYFINNGYVIRKRAEILGRLARDRWLFAVAGTHGKTTTSALLAHLLRYADHPMEAFLGGVLTNYDTNFLQYYKQESNPSDIPMVVEADEYDRSFLKLYPDYGMITALDPDHLDIYGDENSMADAYWQFSKQIRAGGYAMVHQKVKEQFDLEGRNQQGATLHWMTYGLNQGEVKADNIKVLHDPQNGKAMFGFDYISPSTTIEGLKLPLPGYHNIENALAAVSAALHIGITRHTIADGLASFKGVKRRFEYVLPDEANNANIKNGTIFIDDYAHHPTEITALIKSVRALYPGKKITGIFQPHLYSRTRDFSKDFAAALDKLDVPVLIPIYPAREKPMEGVTSHLIMEDMNNINKKHIEKDEVLDFVESQDFEVLITIGAGDIDRLVQPIKAQLTKSGSANG